MNCKKKVFQTPEEANKRAGEINSKNAKTKNQKEQLRPYKCDICSKWHLTKMDKHQYKYVNDVRYRSEVREKTFIKREAEYWEDYFGLP